MERLLKKYIEIKTSGLAREEGQTAVEYTLVLALVVAMATAAVLFTDLESAIGDAIDAVATELGNAI